MPETARPRRHIEDHLAFVLAQLDLALIEVGVDPGVFGLQGLSQRVLLPVGRPFVYIRCCLLSPYTKNR